MMEAPRLLDLPVPTAPSLAVDDARLRRRFAAVAVWLSAPPTPETPLPLRGTAVRVLSLGVATLLGAALLYGVPDETTLRRHACAVAGCAAVTAPATGAAAGVAAGFAAGRAGVVAPTSEHP